MLCYLCLQEKEDTLPIFGEIVEYNIPQMMEKHLDVKPMPNEREPCEICSNCWIKLSDFHEYYQSITEAQNVLKHKILPTESEKEPLFITDYIEVKHDCDNVIKEEFLDDTSRNSITNDFLETEDPFEELATDDNKKQSKNTTNKYAKCNPIKRAKRKNLPRRKKIKIAETNSENEESEELKPLSVLLEDIKREDANANISKRGKPRTIESKCGRQKSTNDIIRRRKGLTLLEENNALIKKHIKMLCQMCPHTSNDFQELIKHFKEEHLDIKPHIKCCDRKLDCPSDILQHAFYHENPEHFKCSECEKTFINKSGLRDHYMQYHEPEENLPYGCDHCPRRFSRKNVLEHHRSKHVPITERSHYCNICQPPRAFANDYILQIHVKNRHTKATNICHVCAKEIRDKQAFEKHVRLHFEKSGPRLKCPREGCDSWLKDEDNLKQHLRRFHDVRQYECPECGRLCKNKHSLTCHLKNTHTNKNFSCTFEDCQKSFKSQQTLKEHMAGHTGEPLYSCPFCTRTFNSKANMYSHKKKTHPEEWNRSRMGLT